MSFVRRVSLRDPNVLMLSLSRLPWLRPLVMRQISPCRALEYRRQKMWFRRIGVTCWNSQILLQEYAEHNQLKAVDILEEDVLEVSMDMLHILQLLAAFHEKAAIFFFTGRLPPMHFIRNWLNSLLQSDVVDEIFDGPVYKMSSGLYVELEILL
ncbi:hypothetical protein L7F22_050664 [Adiantum nelumboides]|nr:hypothetical protein [Adiantum nelumboides]